MQAHLECVLIAWIFLNVPIIIKTEMKNDAKIIDFFNKPIRKVLYKNSSVTIFTMLKRLQLGQQKSK